MQISLNTQACLVLSAGLITGFVTENAEAKGSDQIWTGDLELGFVNTSGNTEKTSLKSKADINREKEQWRYNIKFNNVNTESNDRRTAEKYFISNRLAYQYNESDFSFLYGSYDDDRFTGFQYQATLSAGYGRRLINDDTMMLDIEVGPGYRESKVEDSSKGENSEEVILRGFAGLKWNVSNTAKFTETFNIESGNENTVAKSVTGLQVQINGHLALKLSYTVKYTEEVPNNRKHADTESGVTFLYSF